MNIDTNIDTMSMFHQFVFHKNPAWTLCPGKNNDVNIDSYIDTPSMCEDLSLSKQPAWTNSKDIPKDIVSLENENYNRRKNKCFKTTQH